MPLSAFSWQKDGKDKKKKEKNKKKEDKSLE
jgi:hypothetical protein